MTEFCPELEKCTLITEIVGLWVEQVWRGREYQDVRFKMPVRHPSVTVKKGLEV